MSKVAIKQKAALCGSHKIKKKEEKSMACLLASLEWLLQCNFYL